MLGAFQQYYTVCRINPILTSSIQKYCMNTKRNRNARRSYIGSRFTLFALTLPLTTFSLRNLLSHFISFLILSQMSSRVLKQQLRKLHEVREEKDNNLNSKTIHSSSRQLKKQKNKRSVAQATELLLGGDIKGDKKKERLRSDNLALLSRTSNSKSNDLMSKLLAKGTD